MAFVYTCASTCILQFPAYTTAPSSNCHTIERPWHHCIAKPPLLLHYKAACLYTILRNVSLCRVLSCIVERPLLALLDHWAICDAKCARHTSFSSIARSIRNFPSLFNTSKGMSSMIRPKVRLARLRQTKDYDVSRELGEDGRQAWPP